MINRRNVEFVIYWAGMMLFGIFYYPLKTAVGSPWLFVVIALAWIAVVRLAGTFVRRKWFGGADAGTAGSSDSEK